MSYLLSYCIPDDVCYFRDDLFSPRRATSLKRQSNMVLAGEYIDDTHAMRSGWIMSDPGNDNQTDRWEVRHLGGSNVAYMDGHVAFHRPNPSDKFTVTVGGTEYNQWGLPPYPQALHAGFQNMTLQAWLALDTPTSPHPVGHIPPI